jgi:hypothetical protein
MSDQAHDRSRRLPGVFVLVSLLACALSAIARAQPRPSGPCDPGRKITAPADLRVVRACAANGKVYETTMTADANGEIVVLVPGLDSYISYYHAEKDPNPNPLEDPAKIILFLNGTPIPKFYALLPPAGYSHLRFDLNRVTGSTDNRQAWSTLLSDALRGRRVPLSAGFESERPFASDVNDFELKPLTMVSIVTWAVMSTALLALLIWAARAGNILRHPGAEPANAANVQPPPRKAYSLARTQMAAWFFVVFATYFLIYLITGALDTITPTVLGLMGISAATGFAATIVDTGAAGAAAPAPPTRGLWTDLVSDDTGMSLPRLQILAWTVVLLFIFARSVYQTLSMPEFSSTLLGLMGISGGTYIGFKKPDQKP